MGAIFGSLCSLMIGLADLGARRATRTVEPLVVAAAFQLIATVVGIATLLAIDSEFRWGDIAIGAASGLGVSIGLACYLVGLQRSTSTVVSPIVGTLSAVIPFLFAVATGDRPSALAWGGAILAIAGLAFIGAAGERQSGVRDGVLWGVLSGLGYGVGLGLLLANSSESGAWPAISQRLIGFVFLGVVATVSGHTLRIERKTRPATLFAGVAAGLSIIFFLLGVQADPTPAVVTASLFPAMTVAVGYFFFDDSVRPAQIGGLFAVLVGVAAVVAG